MNKRSVFILSLAICLPLGSVVQARQPLNYVDLVKRLSDMRYLATLPAEGETCAQWSSYDRASRFDSATGKYVSWDANGDGDDVIRKEGDLLVLAEMEGPGCIWRIWSAAPKDGRVKIYLDGSAEPAVDLPFIGYFNGQNEPFTRPALVHTVAKGWNNYTPIPYQKSCKIVAEKNWGMYYQFTFTTFPKGTRVPTFTRKLALNESAALDEVNQALAQCEPVLSAGPGQAQVRERVSVGPGKSAVAARVRGPRAITTLRMKLDLPPAPVDRELLRDVALQIKWDGETGPAVWSPVGDFFGTAPGLNAYRSWPMGVEKDGWCYSSWYMPFAKEAQIELVNDGNIDAVASLELIHEALPEVATQFGRFHAKWHRDAFLPTEPERWIDWPILKTKGAGRFAGVMLHIWNPRGGWWGEGDEKFFVDGERFPSTIGTGSEDYFGYAWCDPTLFQNAFHNQTYNDGNNRGHVSVNRWHIADNIPFQKSFEAHIEKYYPNRRPTMYAAVAYWYLKPGGQDPYAAVAQAARREYWTNAPVVSKVKGAIEGEALKMLSKTGGAPQQQDLLAFGTGWSNDAHLWWIEARPGDKLELGFPVTRAGKYKVSVQLTKARDYGIVQLSLNGLKVGEAIDLYNPEVIPSGVLPLGTHDLAAGQQKLGVEIIGANEKAVKAYMFGIDYVRLEPAE